MNRIRATHELAMDINVLAEMSKAQGLDKDAEEFYKRAYQLEKKAAQMSAFETEDAIPHFILMRSAAALAFKARLFKESETLIEKCLNENPPIWIRQELNDILNEMKLLKGKSN